MLTTKLILERLDKEGRLFERREQTSRSFALQLMDLLYVRHTQANRNITDITNTPQAVGFNIVMDKNLVITSPPGHAGYGREHITTFPLRIEGQNIGIQVGKGTTAPTPTNYKMEDRINHGRAGAVGAPAPFNNHSFETGDLGGWTETVFGAMDASVSNGVWALKDGTWFCTLCNTGVDVIGDFAQIAQAIDLTNVTHLRFQFRGLAAPVGRFRFEISVDGRPVYIIPLIGQNLDYPNQLADVSAYTGTGVHTVAFRLTATAVDNIAGNGAYLDNIDALNIPELEYGGCELVNIAFAHPNGEFTIRRYFTNNSGVSITVNEIGIQAMGEGAAAPKVWSFLIARDVVSPGVAVDDGQVLRVTYVVQITV